jgi:DNA-binding beta-propeller fold protein YncE
VGVLGGAVRVASGFGALWVTGTTHLLTRIVPTGNGNAPAQSPIEVGQGPIGVATGAGAVWVANAADGTVSKVDPASLGVVTMTGVGADPFSVVVAGDRVFVSSGTQQTVRVVSPSPSHVLTLGTDPHNLVAVGAEVWVAASNPGEVVDVTAGHASP